jgi:hypothetical protein
MNIVLLVSVATTLSAFTSPRDAWEEEIQPPGSGTQGGAHYAAGVATSAKHRRAVAKQQARCTQAIAQSAVLERNLTMPFNQRVYRTEVGLCTPAASNIVRTKTRVASAKPRYQERILAPMFDDQWTLLAAWRKALAAWSHRRDDPKKPI